MVRFWIPKDVDRIALPSTQAHGPTGLGCAASHNFSRHFIVERFDREFRRLRANRSLLARINSEVERFRFQFSCFGVNHPYEDSSRRSTKKHVVRETVAVEICGESARALPLNLWAGLRKRTRRRFLRDGTLLAGRFEQN